MTTTTMIPSDRQIAKAVSRIHNADNGNVRLGSYGPYSSWDAAQHILWDAWANSIAGDDFYAHVEHLERARSVCGYFWCTYLLDTGHKLTLEYNRDDVLIAAWIRQD